MSISERSALPSPKYPSTPLPSAWSIMYKLKHKDKGKGKSKGKDKEKDCKQEGKR